MSLMITEQNNEQTPVSTEQAARDAFVPTVAMPYYDAFAIAHPFTDSAQPQPKSYGGPWLR